MISCYTGIAGSVQTATTSEEIIIGGSSGFFSRGGCFIGDRGGEINNETIRLDDIKDGASNTMIYAEQSDWCKNGRGVNVDVRSDANHGFSLGAGFGGGTGNRIYNLTVVRHRLNIKLLDLAGAGGNLGPNRPLQSAHPGGVNVCLADGSSRFLAEDLDIEVLFDLSDREDGDEVRVDVVGLFDSCIGRLPEEG